MKDKIVDEFYELVDTVDELKLAQVYEIIVNIQDISNIKFSCHKAKINIEVLALLGTVNLALDGESLGNNLRAKVFSLDMANKTHELGITTENGVGIIRITGRGVKRIG